jgi:hypothetical protein
MWCSAARARKPLKKQISSDEEDDGEEDEDEDSDGVDADGGDSDDDEELPPSAKKAKPVSRFGCLGSATPCFSMHRTFNMGKMGLAGPRMQGVHISAPVNVRCSFCWNSSGRFLVSPFIMVQP